MSNIEDPMKEKFTKEKKAFYRGLFYILPFVIIVVVAIIATITGIVGLIIGIVWILIAIAILLAVGWNVLFLIWAQEDVFASFPGESNAIIILRGKGFKEAFMEMRGFGFDMDWNVVDELSANRRQRLRFGMIFFLWPFERRYVHRKKWKKLKAGKVEDREEVLLGVLLKSYIYYIVVLEAEDSGNFQVSVGLEAQVTTKNPYKAIFKIQNWIDALDDFIQGAVRDGMPSNSYTELIKRQDLLKDDKFPRLKEVVGKLLKEFGTEVSYIQIVQVKLTNKEQIEATTKAAIAKFLQEAIKTDADSQRYKITAEVVGPIIDSLKSLGFTDELIKEEIEKEPDRFIRDVVGLMKIRMAGDKAVNIVTSAGGVEGGNPLLEFIALSQALSSSGKQGGAGPSKTSDASEPSSPKSSTKDERVKARLKDLGFD